MIEDIMNAEIGDKIKIESKNNDYYIKMNGYVTKISEKCLKLCNNYGEMIINFDKITRFEVEKSAINSSTLPNQIRQGISSERAS